MKTAELDQLPLRKNLCECDSILLSFDESKKRLLLHATESFSRNPVIFEVALAKGPLSSMMMNFNR